METTASNSNISTTVNQGSQLSTFHIGCIAVIVIIIAINITIIYLFLTRKYLRNSLSNIFLFNLAISDLSVGLIALPLYLACVSQATQSSMKSRLCMAYYFFIQLTGYASVYQILLGITEKFCGICFTIRHYSIFRRSLAIKLSLCVWLVSLIIAHIPQWWLTILPGFDEDEIEETQYRFHIFQFIIAFAIPVVASATMYTMMFRKVSKHLNKMKNIGTYSVKRRVSRLSNERKTALVFGMLFTIFLLCWTGWFILINFRVHPSGLVRNIFVMARYSAAILNPLLYAFMKNDFRKAFQELWKKKQTKTPSVKMVFIVKSIKDPDDDSETSV